MTKNFIEIIVGALVIVIASSFAYIAYTTTYTPRTDNNSMSIVAYFDKVDGINVGSDVKIGGISIGKVIDQKLDYNTFRAKVIMSIDKKISLSVDSSAEIIGNGLLGEKYVSISPGMENEKLKSNGEINFTQSAISLEGLIGKFIFNSAEKSSKNVDN